MRPSKRQGQRLCRPISCPSDNPCSSKPTTSKNKCPQEGGTGEGKVKESSDKSTRAVKRSVHHSADDHVNDHTTTDENDGENENDHPTMTGQC